MVEPLKMKGKLLSAYHFICWSLTISFSIFWIYKYSLNEDLCSMEFKYYYEDKKDVLPMLSLCLRDPFDEQTLYSHVPALNVSSFLNVLQGKELNSTLVDIDYKSLIKNISDYVEPDFAGFRNGSDLYIHPDYSELPYYEKSKFDTGLGRINSLAVFKDYRFYNCYGLSIPHDRTIQEFYFRVKSTIFMSGFRSRRYSLMTIIHYPNQMLYTTHTLKYAWPQERQKNDSYIMRFKISGVEVVRRQQSSSRDGMGATSRGNTMGDPRVRSRSRSRMSVNTAGGNWSSTEGSTCDTMSVALSEMPDIPNTSTLINHHPQFNASGSHIVSHTPQPPLSPDHHLVNRKDLLEQMGLPPAPVGSNHHGRNQPSSRSMGSSGEFNPHWTMNEGSGCHITSRHGRRGRSNHSIDKMSINSGLSSHDGSQSSGDHFDEGRSICTNYDQPRSITTKSMSPQTNTETSHSNIGTTNTEKNSVVSHIPRHLNSFCTDAPPLTPKTKQRMNLEQSKDLADQKELKNIHSASIHHTQRKAPETFIQADNNIKEVLMSAPCPCSSPSADYESLNTNIPANRFVGPYNNYDIPRTSTQQEALQFYDTPKSIKQALNTPEINMANQHRTDEKPNSRDTAQPNVFSGPYENYDVPHAGLAPIPVFRKTCGCIMKLVPQTNLSQCGGGNCNDQGISEDSVVMWKCMPSNVPFGVHDNGCSSNKFPPLQHPQQQHMPRVKLTGSGKMPVMDMKSNNIIHQNYHNVPQPLSNSELEPGSKTELNHTNQELSEQGRNISFTLDAGIHPQVVGLPPKSPVYAVVNKANKRKLEKQAVSNLSGLVNSEPCRGEVDKTMLSFAHSQLHDKQAQTNLPGACSNHDGNSSQNQFKRDEEKNSSIPEGNDSNNELFSHHNYCNIGPVLGDVVTMSKDYLPPPPPEHLLLYNQKQCNEIPTLHQNTFRQGDQFKMSPQTLQSHPIFTNLAPHYYENSAEIVKRLNLQENTDLDQQKEHHNDSMASKSSNYVAMNPSQFFNKSSKDLIDQDEDILPTKDVLPLIPFDPTHNVSMCGTSKPCHEYEEIDPISRRLREMSESIKQTYGDDRLNRSPNHIGIIPLSQIDNNFADVYDINLKRNEDQNVLSAGSNKGQHISSEICNVLENNQITKEENIRTLNESSDVRDISANEDAAKMIDNSKPESTSKSTDKNKHLPGENLAYSVTIPRIQKSHHPHARKHTKLNATNAADALSRSYQHPNNLLTSKGNPSSPYERNGVSMRRSSSVPCKRITVERGSTSSSDDSGFSPGSPNTSAMLAGLSLEQAVQGMHLNSSTTEESNHVPNQEPQNGDETKDASNLHAYSP